MGLKRNSIALGAACLALPAVACSRFEGSVEGASAVDIAFAGFWRKCRPVKFEPSEIAEILSEIDAYTKGVERQFASRKAVDGYLANPSTTEALIEMSLEATRLASARKKGMLQGKHGGLRNVRLVPVGVPIPADLIGKVVNGSTILPFRANQGRLLLMFNMRDDGVGAFFPMMGEIQKLYFKGNVEPAFRMKVGR